MLSRSMNLPAVIQEALGVGTSAPTPAVVPSDFNYRSLNAGLPLLLATTDCMEDLYNRTSLNGTKIKFCDGHIAELYANMENKTMSLANLNMNLGSMREISTQLEKTWTLMKSVKRTLQECDAALLIMEDTMEMVKSRRCQLEVQQIKDRMLKEERQRIFEEQFKNDLERFKESGQLETPVSHSVSPVNDLSEISLDQNEEELHAFNQFLESSGEHSIEEDDQDLSKCHDL
ncbi:dysbindin protein homolog [Galendromus occidentalis]|uniref:Dysbindin protein homolog n=1 Tax=Galendromus occidentalis TaxID=34638 RepID=A0AAJ6QM06_9ACAR|nr:dysbindin protein homolog [Galendromus occidentalis]